jgi:hypothetical protein
MGSSGRLISELENVRMKMANAYDTQKLARSVRIKDKEDRLGILISHRSTLLIPDLFEEFSFREEYKLPINLCWKLRLYNS